MLCSILSHSIYSNHGVGIIGQIGTIKRCRSIHHHGTWGFSCARVKYYSTGQAVSASELSGRQVGRDQTRPPCHRYEKNHGYQEKRIAAKETREKQNSTPKKPFRTPVGKNEMKEKSLVQKGVKMTQGKEAARQNHQRPPEGEGGSQLIFEEVFSPFIYTGTIGRDDETRRDVTQ